MSKGKAFLHISPLCNGEKSIKTAVILYAPLRLMIGKKLTKGFNLQKCRKVLFLIYTGGKENACT